MIFSFRRNLSLDAPPVRVIDFSHMKLLLLLIALVAPFTAYSQNKVPPKHVRFIPLGELPTWAEDIVDGIRKQRKSPAGSVPPSLISYAGGDEPKNLRLSLRSFSGLASFPADSPGILLKEGGDFTGAEFLTTKLPASSLSLGVLFRDFETMTWGDPKLLMLPDDAQSFPLGQMRFVNVSDLTVVVKMGDGKAFGIAPGKVSMKPLEVGTTPIKVGYVPKEGGSKAIWQNNVKLRSGQRMQCFFYKAQGKNPRSAVKFHFAPERVPALPRPKR